MIRITTAREPVSSLVYHVCGAGPDVLLLHGWLGSGRMWHGVMRALSPYFRSWAPDLPGFGASPLPEDAEPSSLADYQHSVRTFCDALSVRPYALVGHSMGALLALSLAVEHPELMDRLVLLSPPVRGRIGLRLDVPLRTM
ncbi:MAG: alpha/beta hydrolase, partial [Anaerolineae bacterium]|nr:alpha/beta hydrolase [Anaerolineae bacterium]